MGTKKSKNTDNPFADLDIRQFPADRKQRGTQRQQGSLSSSGGNAAPLDKEAGDSALFFQAVGAAQPLTGRSPARRPASSPGGTAGAHPAPDKDAAREKWRASSRLKDERKSAEPSPEGSQCDTLAQELARRQIVLASTPRAGERQGTASARAEKASAAIPDATGLPKHETEHDVFCRAMADVTPLPGKGRAVVPEPAPQPGPAFEPSNPLQELVDGKVEFSLSGTDEFMEGHVVGLDLLTVGKLQARQYSPEAHIDLHGLNSEQAFQYLVHFFRGAYYKGVRTALVVTGRGLNSPNGIPVLRFKVQEWLTQDPFRRVILAFCTAKREDGGPGALYVLLRKYRKNSGKVRWDAMPADPDLFL